MVDYGISTYGDRIAGVYDDWPTQPQETEQACALFQELAAGGRVLELGVGTGRLAIPLRERGVDVHGIDASERMVERLRAKLGGAGIPVVIGDFQELPVEGSFQVIFAAYSSFLLLNSQEAQVTCMRSVARHLTDTGAFVVEAEVPNLERLSRPEHTSTGSVDVDTLWVNFSRHDVVRQLVRRQQMVIKNGTVEMYPIFYRYVWPSELDLMAQLAGLSLRSRWSNWIGAPFGASTTRHISIYEPHP